MEEKQAKELTEIAVKNIKFEKDDLDGTVDVVTNFSKENSISPDLLLKISKYYISNEKYTFAYIFAKASSNLSIGNVKATAHYNAGVASILMNHKEEAEMQYKLALEANPKHVATHRNYGTLLREMGRNEEAEKHYKIAIELDPNEPDSHVAYGILLLLKNLESKAIEETRIASKLFGEKGDKINEHIPIACLHEILYNKYYLLEIIKRAGNMLKSLGMRILKRANSQKGNSRVLI
jgi:tetratricopeptide (TPR) repeat protein